MHVFVLLATLCLRDYLLCFGPLVKLILPEPVPFMLVLLEDDNNHRESPIMLPEEEFKALKRAHQELQTLPTTSRPMNFSRLVSHYNSQGELKCAWSDSTVSECCSSSKLQERTAKSGRARQNPPFSKAHARPGESTARQFGYASSTYITMAGRQPASTPPRQPSTPPFTDFDITAYEAAQANGRGSIYGAEVLMVNRAEECTRNQTRYTTSRRRASPSGSNMRETAQQQQSQHYFRNPENRAVNAGPRPPSMDPYAFAVATQGVDQEPRLAATSSRQPAQSSSARQATSTQVRPRNGQPSAPPANDARRHAPPQSALSDQEPPRYSTSPPPYRRTPPEQERQERPQAPPARRPNPIKRLWKRIF